MKILLIFFILVGVFVSCEQVAGEGEGEGEGENLRQQQITQDDLEQQLVAIEALIENGSCETDSDCNYIAYGSKACGGPQGYLIFSSNIDTDQLRSMVDRYNKDEAAYNEQHGIMSDCSIPPEPQNLACDNGDCVRID